MPVRSSDGHSARSARARRRARRGGLPVRARAARLSEERAVRPGGRRRLPGRRAGAPPGVSARGHREKLRMIGREDDLEPLNRDALRLAREVAAEGGALVAGNICNTWAYDPDDPAGSGEIVREMYREQVGWAVEERADYIVAETNDYLGEALIGLEVIREFGLPAVVTFASTMDTTI